jgi:anti-sigma B factor antagonist
MRLLRNSPWTNRSDVSVDVSLREDGVTVIHVGGELDLSSVPQLRSCLSDLVNRGDTNLLLDLSEVTFCDSTALGVFVGAHRRVVASGGHIEFHKPPASLRNLLVVSGLDQILHLS